MKLSLPTRIIPLIFASACLSYGMEVITLSVKGIQTSTSVEVYSQETIELAAGDYAKIISQYDTGGGYQRGCMVTIKGIEQQVPSSAQLGANSTWGIAGPASLRARTISSPSYGIGAIGFFTAEVTRAGASPQTAPSNTVVIPEDEQGSYKVVLESSTDMITWAEANPGTYGGSTTKRFFRTRIIRQ